jgi:hypothetical protein
MAMVRARTGFGQIMPALELPPDGQAAPAPSDGIKSYPAICDWFGGGWLEKFTDVCTPQTPEEIFAAGNAADEAMIRRQRALGYDTTAAEAVLAKNKADAAALIAADLKDPRNCAAKFYYDHPTLAKWISGDTVCGLTGGDAALGFNLLVVAAAAAAAAVGLVVVLAVTRR